MNFQHETMPTSLSAFDSRPSYLKLLPSDSKELSGGLAKLRMIVSYNMPQLEGGTPSDVIHRINALDEAKPAKNAAPAK